MTSLAPSTLHTPTHTHTHARSQTFGDGKDLVKVYHHFAYKIEAAPPFRVCAVSREIGLVTRKPQKKGDWTHQRIWKDTSQTAYIAGLFMKGDSVLMSYGSSDIDARLLTINIAELEGLFDQPMNCAANEILRVPEGFTAPAPDAAGLPGAAGVAAGPGASVAQASEEGGIRQFYHRRHRRSHRRDNDGGR